MLYYLMIKNENECVLTTLKKIRELDDIDFFQKLSGFRQKYGLPSSPRAAASSGAAASSAAAAAVASSSAAAAASSSSAAAAASSGAAAGAALSYPDGIDVVYNKTEMEDIAKKYEQIYKENETTKGKKGKYTKKELYDIVINRIDETGHGFLFKIKGKKTSLNLSNTKSDLSYMLAIMDVYEKKMKKR